MTNYTNRMNLERDDHQSALFIGLITNQSSQQNHLQETPLMNYCNIQLIS